MSNSLQLHELQHARLPSPSLSPGVCSDSCPLNHPIISSHCPLLLLPSIFPSIRAFSNESALCIRWPNSGSFSFSISPSNEYSELISIRTNRFEIGLFHLSSTLLYDGKESACNAGDLGSIPGREDPLEKGVSTHSSILAWRIPWTENLAGYSTWSHRAGHD